MTKASHLLKIKEDIRNPISNQVALITITTTMVGDTKKEATKSLEVAMDIIIQTVVVRVVQLQILFINKEDTVAGVGPRLEIA